MVVGAGGEPPDPPESGVEERRRGGLHPVTGDGQGCQARGNTTALPLGFSWGCSTATTKLAPDRPAQSLMMVTLLGRQAGACSRPGGCHGASPEALHAASRLLQAMGMPPTLVSLGFPPSAREALDCNPMLGRLLRRLKGGVRALPWRLPFRRPHQWGRA